MLGFMATVLVISWLFTIFVYVGLKRGWIKDDYPL
mgnify:CR=1 FL=1